MECAAIILAIFLVAIVVVAITIPVLIISRCSRLIKNSVAKLFHKSARKA